MPNTNKGVEIDSVREKLINIIAHTSCVAVSSRTAAGHIADNLIANGVAVQEWISVTERLPEKGGKYLVAIKYGDGYVVSARKFRKEASCWWAGASPRWERRTAGVRFWMPLPQPPKGE